MEKTSPRCVDDAEEMTESESELGYTVVVSERTSPKTVDDVVEGIESEFDKVMESSSEPGCTVVASERVSSASGLVIQRTTRPSAGRPAGSVHHVISSVLRDVRGHRLLGTSRAGSGRSASLLRSRPPPILAIPPGPTSRTRATDTLIPLLTLGTRTTVGGDSAKPTFRCHFLSFPPRRRQLLRPFLPNPNAAAIRARQPRPVRLGMGGAVLLPLARRAVFLVAFCRALSRHSSSQACARKTWSYCAARLGDG